MAMAMAMETPTFKVVVAGSRSIQDIKHVIDALDQAKKGGYIPEGARLEIVSGGAMGVDTLARYVAEKFGFPLSEIKPDYSRHRRGAPFKRNTEMAIYGDVLVAVWDGESRGTQHMINQMRAQNKPVFLHRVQL